MAGACLLVSMGFRPWLHEHKFLPAWLCLITVCVSRGLLCGGQNPAVAPNLHITCSGVLKNIKTNNTERNPNQQE